MKSPGNTFVSRPGLGHPRSWRRLLASNSPWRRAAAVLLVAGSVSSFTAACAQGAVSGEETGTAVEQRADGERVDGERARVRRMIAPEERAVRWDEVRTMLRSGRMMRLPYPRTTARSAIETCNVPIMLPAHRDVRGKMALYPKENYYAAFYQGKDYSLEVIGSRLAQPVRRTANLAQRMTYATEEGYSQAQRQAGSRSGTMSRMQAQRQKLARESAWYADGPVVLSNSEYGVNLSFTAFNASYTVSLQCANADANSACNKDDFILSLVRSMAYVGGVPKGGAPIREGRYVDGATIEGVRRDGEKPE